MRRIGIVILGLWFIIPQAAFGLDIRIAGGFGNLAFDKDGTGSLGLRDETFDSAKYPFGLVRLEGDYSDIISFDAGFELDPILRNRITTNISFYTSYIRFDIGPFMGLFNTEGKIINPGISSVLTLEIPGILFGSVSAASTLGASVSTRGDYLQESGGIALGFWIPYVICTLSLESKAFTEQADQNLVTKDERMRYQLRADVFKKNVPYTVYVDIGYQSLKRSYTTTTIVTTPAAIPGNADTITSVTVTDTDEFKSIYTGFEATLRMNSFLKLILGAEMPVYSWAEKPLKKPGKGLSFQVHGGFIVTIPE
jgi:hypothetical protein